MKNLGFDVAVCMRDYGPASHTPLTHGFGKCAKCGHPIFWAKSMEQVPASVPRWCADCMLDKLEELANEEGKIGQIAAIDQYRAHLRERSHV